MPYEDLLGQGRLAQQPPSSKAIQDLFSLAERDIHVAEHTLEVDPDWAFNIAYNAVLQAARAFVLSEGYRTRGADQHATVVFSSRGRSGRDTQARSRLSTRCGAGGTAQSTRPPVA